MVFCFYFGWSGSILQFRQNIKLIGVQSNHGVEYFGGPAAPTLRFQQNQQFLPQYRLHTESKEAYAENLAKIASELSILEPI